MDRINWQPGEQGKGIVDEDGNVHAWNDEDYELHRDYIDEHPDVGSPRGHFYIGPDGAIDVSYPSAGYDIPGHDLAMEHICEADPHFHAGKADWTF
jgi:hypothetical protein